MQITKPRGLALAMLLFFISVSHAEPIDDSFSAQVWDYLVNGATLTIGAGVRQSGIKVIRTSDRAEGTVVQRNDEAYFLSYSTRPTYFRTAPNAGYTFSFNLSSFDADQQEIDKDVFEDIGTRVSGSFVYVVPTVFYEWGNYHNTGRFTRLGFGLGLGFTQFNGDIILTESTDQQRLDLSSEASKLRVASSFILETRWNHWGLSLSVAGPSFATNDYEIQVQDTAIHLGYSFVF
ncbi:MAG: hypothetical protein OQL09_03950 [Gammaproteobacteria bacterium]|nr:hypothetical protein [Gammaproteobacteria bacterium]